MIGQGSFRLAEKHEKTEDLKDEWIYLGQEFKKEGRVSKALGGKQLFKSKDLRGSQCDRLRQKV